MIEKLPLECAIPHGEQMVLIHERGAVHPRSRDGCDLYALHGGHMIWRNKQPMPGHSAPSGATTFVMYLCDSYNAFYQPIGRWNG